MIIITVISLKHKCRIVNRNKRKIDRKFVPCCIDINIQYDKIKLWCVICNKYICIYCTTKVFDRNDKMNLGNLPQLNTDKEMDIIDSILNVYNNPVLIIDKENSEILYQNNKAVEIFDNKIGLKFNELANETEKWQFSDIKWVDEKSVVLAALSDTETMIMSVAATDDDGVYDKDTLTDIPNYSQFYKNAGRDIFSHSDKNFAIVVFDIDRFKTINDLYGMSKGDEALRYIASVLKGVFPDGENYARLHSDRFAYYIEYKNKGEIIRNIEKIRKKIYACGLGFDIHTSYGIYLAEDLSVPVNLMCDRAMIASRTAKGNVLRFCSFYDEQYREDMLKANEIENEMNKALEDGDFKMYLQPKYRLTDGSLCGAEVLCRWQHPQKGIIPPMDFIPLFEKNGFILKLDEYMWEQACITIRNWLDEGRVAVPLSVNISRYHIKHNDLEAVFGRLIEKYQIPVEMLALEITESLFLDKPEELNRELVKLQKKGFKLEVDDFGSGFSSLNLIRNVTVDTIKIDKDFLDSEIASEKGKIVINHTIDMAKDLQLQVIAEGVETQAHVDFLKNSRCDIAQGFYFAKPMPLDEFNKLSF